MAQDRRYARLKHAHPGWRDIIGPVDIPSTGSNKPTLTTVGSGPFKLWAFGVGNMAQFIFHVPHDFDPSTDWYIHTHWKPSGTDANAVVWQWTYSYAKSHDQEAFDPNGTVISGTQDINATPEAYRHYTTESDPISVDISEPDGLIIVNVERITNGTTPPGSNENGDDILMLTTDIHYWSTGVPTPNKEPNFYV